MTETEKYLFDVPRSGSRAPMTEEQRWAFELDGYILLPSLLGAPAAAHATPAALAEHPDLLAAIDQLAGGELPLWHRAAYDGTEGKEQEFHTIKFELDRPPRRLTKEGQWANDLTVDEQRRLGYDTTSRPDRACVWGLRALWGRGRQLRGGVSRVAQSQRPAAPEHGARRGARGDGAGAAPRWRLSARGCHHAGRRRPWLLAAGVHLLRRLPLPWGGLRPRRDGRGQLAG